MWVNKKWGCVVLNGHPKNGENIFMTQAIHGHSLLEQQGHLYLACMV